MRKRRAPGRAGFTIIEVLVAMSLMAIGMLGIVALMRGATSASGYSRRATEAAVLAEDKLEELRTVPLPSVADGSDLVDAAGVANPDGPFLRTWTLTPDGNDLVTILVEVAWSEADGDHAIRFRTLRWYE